jgi:hypothetical protein
LGASSVFDRTGAVVAAAGDYTAVQVGAFALSQYRRLFTVVARAAAANIVGAAVYPFAAPSIAAAASANLTPAVFYLAAADHAVTGYTTKLRVASGCLVDDVAPGQTLVIGLYPVGTPSGGVGVFNPNLGTVVTGSTVTWTTPAANSSAAEQATADFGIPADGWYCFGMSVGGAFTVASDVVLPARLEVRNV